MKIKVSNITLGFFVCSVIFLPIAVLIFILGRNYILHQLNLTNGTMIYPQWVHPDVETYHDVYLFNVTNAKQVIDGSKPLLDRIGPFTFSIKTYKDSYFNDNNTISFRETRRWSYESSKYPLDTEIVTINTPLATMLSLLPNKLALPNISSNHLKYTEPFVKRKVSSLLFDRYSDILMRLAPALNRKFSVYNGYFSYYYIKNGSSDGLFTVSTDRENLNLIQNINGENTIPDEVIVDRPPDEKQNGVDFNLFSNSILEFLRVRPSPMSRRNSSDPKAASCKDFKDSTRGEIHPRLQKNPKLYIGDLCRSVPLKYLSKMSMGLMSVQRWTFEDNVFQNNNDCKTKLASELLCQLGEPKSCTLRPGVIDASQCSYGAPLLISQPYFHNAHEWYSDSVQFLEKDTNNSDYLPIYLDYHTTTGSFVAMNIELQINVAIYNPKWFIFGKAPSVVMPVLIQRLRAQAGDGMLRLLWLADVSLHWYPLIAAIICALLVIAWNTLLALDTYHSLVVKNEDETAFVNESSTQDEQKLNE